MSRGTSFVVAAGEMTDLGWRQTLRSKMLWGIGAAIVFATVLMLIIHTYAKQSTAAEDFQAFEVFILAQVVVPLIALLLGTGALATERESGTLSYLFTRPFRRSAAVVGKGLGAIIVANVATVVAVLAVYVAAGMPDAQVAGGMVALMLEATALTGIFVLFGTLLARSLYLGLAYVAVFEGLLGNSLGGRSGWTVSYHARNMLTEWSGSHFTELGALPGTAANSVFALLVVTVAALAAAAAWVETREYGLRDRAKEE